jgi:hypothetical protein
MLSDEDRSALAELADHVEHGPARLKARILAAAANGGRPSEITKAIGHVYTYDYVATLTREVRKARGAQSPSDSPTGEDGT